MSMEHVEINITEQIEAVTLEVNDLVLAANGLPAGGAAGQVLVKQSPASHHARWETLPKTTGYAVYSDTEYYEGHEFRLEADVWTPVPNNAGRVFAAQLPDGLVTLYNPATQRLLAADSGDQMGFRIDLNIRPSVSGVRCLLGIDIGGTQGVFVKKSFVLGEAAIAEDHSESIAPAFGGDTFVANGGAVVMFTPHPVDIFGAVFLSSVESKARIS